MKINTEVLILAVFIFGCCFWNTEPHPTALEDSDEAFSEENVLQEQDSTVPEEYGTNINAEEEELWQKDDFITPAVADEDNVIAEENEGLNELMATDEQQNDWVKIPGGLKHISTSISYVWGVNRFDNIYRCNRPCNGRWIHVPGKLKQIDVGKTEVWGVNSNNYIYKRSANGAGGWRNIGGRLIHVSASGNGYIWGVNHFNNIFSCRKPCTGQWKHIPGSIKLKQIDGGHKWVFGVNSGGVVYRRLVDGSGGWIRILGARKMKYVTVGACEVFGVDMYSNQLRCKLPCATGNWQAISSSVCEAKDIQQIEATNDGLVATTKRHSIFKRRLY